MIKYKELNEIILNNERVLKEHEDQIKKEYINDGYSNIQIYSISDFIEYIINDYLYYLEGVTINLESEVSVLNRLNWTDILWDLINGGRFTNKSLSIDILYKQDYFKSSAIVIAD